MGSRLAALAPRLAGRLDATAATAGRGGGGARTASEAGEGEAGEGGAGEGGAGEGGAGEGEARRLSRWRLAAAARAVSPQVRLGLRPRLGLGLAWSSPNLVEP